jgi:hypothetical protein
VSLLIGIFPIFRRVPTLAFPQRPLDNVNELNDCTDDTPQASHEHDDTTA